MTLTSEQNIFLQLLELLGFGIEVASKRDGAVSRGLVTNVMFDSVMLSKSGKNLIIRFEDILYLNPHPAR